MTDIEKRYLRAKRRLFDAYYETRLNAEQREAVCSVRGPLLILAGAGSGKTTVLVNRVAHIIRYGDAYYCEEVPEGISESDVLALEEAASFPSSDIEQILPEFVSAPCPPWAILAITFTNKAAGEIKERLAAAFDDESISNEIWAGTFHSICVRILRKYADRAGYAEGFSIYDTEDKKRLVAGIMKELNIDEKILPLRSVTSEISAAKDALVTPEAYECGVTDLRRKHIKAIYTEYQRRIVANNAMDFDDIIAVTVRLLSENPDVAEYYQNRFRYVCVDEYQDTNYAQFVLTSLLSAKYRNIMVVGDDDQSIYRFRGATVENILNFDKTYPDAKVIKLEQNYRSTQKILSAANALIAHNEDRHAKALWCAGNEGEPITLFQGENQNDEGHYIINKIMFEVVHNRRHYRDFAVLYRINEMARSVESSFAKSGIPYRVLGGQRFYDRAEIRDMIAYLYLIANAGDDQRLKRVINEPKRKIGDATVEAVEQIARAEGRPMFAVMRESEKYESLSKVAPRLLGFVSLIDGIREERLSVSETLRAVYERSGYEKMLAEEGEQGKTRADVIREFVSAAVEYETRNPEEATLSGFLEETALVSDVDKYDADADAVVLMTIHSAKGLEFPIVFLAGMEDGIFPGLRATVDAAEMSEERRLAYVAITRAKEKIYVTAVRDRMLYGRTQYGHPSRFIVGEIPKELVVCDNMRKKTAERYQPSPVPRGRAHMAGEFFRRADSSGAPAVSPAANTAPARSPGAERRFAAGDRVLHSTFGAGQVLSVKDMGGDTLYEVLFDSDRSKSKKLMATYAKLTPEQ